MATQDLIDKIINIRFNYKELVQGWVKANEAIEDNKKILADLKKEYETGQILYCTPKVGHFWGVFYEI